MRKQFKAHFRSDVVNKAIAETPAKAGITIEQLEGIAKSCIKLETNNVSAISFATGLPGGIALIGAIPADITQYFAHIIRILQKLIYLYGWEELYESKDDLDDETLYWLTLFIGIMFGVGTANAAITKIAQSAASIW
ncbi:MAG TPA: hypothetical protein PKA19_11205 [Bacillota bacterium]|nr:hypothetical protein [Bacillota bacterium]